MRIFTIIRLINLIVHIRAPNFLPSTDMNVIRIQVSGHSLIILSRHKLWVEVFVILWRFIATFCRNNHIWDWCQLCRKWILGWRVRVLQTSFRVVFVYAFDVIWVRRYRILRWSSGRRIWVTDIWQCNFLFATFTAFGWVNRRVNIIFVTLSWWTHTDLWLFGILLFDSHFVIDLLKIRDWGIARVLLFQGLSTCEYNMFRRNSDLWRELFININFYYIR